MVDLSTTQSTIDGEISSCASSLAGTNPVNLYVTALDPTLLVVKATVPQTNRIHITYKFMMFVRSQPNTTVTNVAFLRLYVAKDEIVTDEKNALYFKRLSPTNGFLASYTIGTSTDANIAGDYYFTIMGFISSVSITEAFFNDFEFVFCEVLDASNFDPLTFDFSVIFRLPLISSSNRPVSSTTLLLFACFIIINLVFKYPIRL